MNGSGGDVSRAVATHTGSSLAAAARSAIASTLHGGEPLSVLARDHLLRAAPESMAQLPPEELPIVRAGMILARARWGSVDDAVTLARAELERRDEEYDAQLPSASQAALWASMSEAFSTAALPRLGLVCAERMLDYALDTGEPVWAYRGYGLQAAAAAFAGDVICAEGARAHAEAIAREHAWTYTIAAYPLIAAELLIGSARMDAAGLSDSARRSRAVDAQMPIWASFAAIAEAMSLMLNQQAAMASSVLMEIVNGAHAPALPRIAFDFSLSLLATLNIARSRPQLALTLLNEAPSDAEHVVCLDLQRASACLQLGDFRGVLIATDPCIKLGTLHCLRTLPGVLLRRAIANLQLGHDHAADESFADAFHLMHAAGSATPLLTLDRPAVQTLFERLRRNEPQLAASIDALQQHAWPVPAVAPPPPLPTNLSEREIAVAALLRRGLTLREIAAELFVSVNTVKTQTRVLYRKLDVASRHDAVSYLERAGLFD